MKNWKFLPVTLALTGLLAITLFVARKGAGPVIEGVLSVGYLGFLLLSGWQFIVAAVLGIAWQAIASTASSGLLLPVRWIFTWARLVRDASASCLPFSQVGGFAIGARVLVLHGETWPVASATTIGDMTTEFLAEIVFAIAGVAILGARHFEPGSSTSWALATVLVLIIGPGLISLPRRAAPLCGRLASRIAAQGLDFIGSRQHGMDVELKNLYARTGHFVAGTALHFLGWVAKGIGGWIAFRLLGVPIGLLDALAIEGLLHAALAGAFFVPGYLGVQEGGYMLLGSAFGVPAELALATSLLRRARDIAIGIPILLVWQLVELRRLRTGRRPSE